MKFFKKLSLVEKRAWEGFAFTLPWVIGFFVFFLFPLVTSIMLSFGTIKNAGSLAVDFVGFAQYKLALFERVDFWANFATTVRDTLIHTPMIVLFSLIIAVMLNKNMMLRGFFRQVFFLPVLLGAGFVMEQLLGQNVEQQAMEVARGILLPDEILLYLGPKVAEYVGLFLDNITLVLWKSGVEIILFLAGLQGISPSLYESARVDSATEWEMFWKITLPMISPMILLNIIYALVDSFNNAENALVQYIYDCAFTNSWFEYSAAMSWLYMLFVGVLIGLVFLIMRRFVHTAV